MPPRISVLLALLWLTAPAAVAAGEDPGRPDAKLRLMGNMGVASAVGEMGGTFTYAPVPALQLEVGAGLGFSGLQLSLMPKVTVGGRHHHLSAGVGPSVGIGANPAPSATCVSYWLNAEAGYEYRSVRGFAFLVAVGVGKGIGGTMPGSPGPGLDPARAVAPESVARQPAFPQGRIALGRWF